MRACGCGALILARSRQCGACYRQGLRPGFSVGARQANDRRHMEAVARHQHAAFHCESCGVAFWRKPNQAKHDARRFCSKKCSGAARTAVALLRQPQIQQAKLVRQEQVKAENEIARTIAAALKRALVTERKPKQKRWHMWRQPQGVHVCPDCGKSFLGHARRVYCSAKCARVYTHHQRYPAIRGFAVVERNEMASLLSLVRAAQRKLQHAV